MKTKRIAYCHPGAPFSDCFAAARREGYDEFVWNGGRFTTKYAEEAAAEKPTYGGHPIERGEIVYEQPVDRWLEGWRDGREAAAAEATRLAAEWGEEAREFTRDGYSALSAQRRGREATAGYVADVIRAMPKPALLSPGSR